jgi:hypothetical protein
MSALGSSNAVGIKALWHRIHVHWILLSPGCPGSRLSEVPLHLQFEISRELIVRVHGTAAVIADDLGDAYSGFLSS